MSREQNIELGRRLVEAWSVKKGGDIEPLMALFAEDVDYRIMVDTDLFPEFKGPWTKAAIRDYVAAETGALDVVLKIKSLIADDKSVVVECMADMTIGVHPYNNNYCFVVGVEGGKIKSLRIYMDSLLGKQAMVWLLAEIAKASAA